MQIHIETNIEYKDWANAEEVNFNIEELINNILGIIISHHEDLFKNIENVNLGILLTDNSKIQKLNKEFRNKDKPTNVLSFPEHEELYFTDYNSITEDTFTKDIYLGDIAISFDKLKEEALDMNISFKNHFEHLVTHSLLHLLGYDHEEDNEAEIMEALERNILLKIQGKNA